MNKNDRKFIVACCLDEIDACYDKLEKGKLSQMAKRNLTGWVRRQKETLKEVKYRGKLRRLIRGC